MNGETSCGSSLFGMENIPSALPEKGVSLGCCHPVDVGSGRDSGTTLAPCRCEEGEESWSLGSAPTYQGGFSSLRNQMFS